MFTGECRIGFLQEYNIILNDRISWPIEMRQKIKFVKEVVKSHDRKGDSKVLC